MTSVGRVNGQGDRKVERVFVGDSRMTSVDESLGSPDGRAPMLVRDVGDDPEVEIFASSWPADVPAEAVPEEEGEIIFAQAWPAHDALAPAPAAEASPAIEPDREIDQLWADFDAEVTHNLVAGHCPYCDSFVDVDFAEATVTCALCGGTYATFHATQGQA